MSNPFPPKDVTIEALIEAAREAASNNTAEHPEDVATAMSIAIDAAWPAIFVTWKHAAG